MKPKIDRRKPQSAWAAQWVSAIVDLTKLDGQIAQLREERKKLMAGIPCGVYHLVDENVRVVIADHVSSRVSIKLLRNYVTPEIVRRCTARSISRSIEREALRR